MVPQVIPHLKEKRGNDWKADRMRLMRFGRMSNYPSSPFREMAKWVDDIPAVP